MSAEPDDILEDSRRETAFNREGHKLFGAQLFPFTPQRAAAAAAIGMQWPNVASKDWREVGKDTEGQPIFSYPALFADSIFLLFLCSIHDEKIDEAFIEPADVRRKAFVWAEEKKIQMGAPQAREVANVFFAIMGDATASKFKTAEKAENGGEPIDPN